MKRPFYTGFIAALTISYQLSAQAAPTLYPKDSSILGSLKNQTQAQVLADHKDKNMFYVMPPANGYAYGGGISLPSANINYCENLKKIQSSSLSLLSHLDQLKAEYIRYEKMVEQKQAELNQAREKAAEYAGANSGAQQIKSVQDQLNSVRVRLDDLYANRESCEGSCEDIKAEIQNQLIQQRGLQQQLRYLNQTYAAERMQFDALMEKVATKEKILEDAENANRDATKRYLDLNKDLLEIYSLYGAIDGGYTTVEYSSQWENAVDQLRLDNPGKAFEKTDLYNVAMSASIVPNENFTAVAGSLPAILDYTVSGQSPSTGIEFKEYPSQFSATFRLSLVGACPIIDPIGFNATNFQGGKPAFGFTSRYDYQVMHNTKINFDYNEYHFFERVIKSGSKGGFFSRKSWKTVSETKIDTLAMKFNWDVSDPATKLTFEERRRFEQDAVNWAIMLTLPKVAVPVTNQNSTPGGVPASGASVLAQGLKEVCGATNIYCAAGSWALKGLDAIFGRSHSTGSFRSVSNKTINVVWDESMSRETSGMTSFNTNKPGVKP